MSALFKLNGSDFTKGLIMAIFMGVALPIVAVIQTPGFDLFTANWEVIGKLALNGAFLGFATYLSKNFLSDENGKVLGRFG